jgi:hypothetical protein
MSTKLIKPVTLLTILTLFALQSCAWAEEERPTASADVSFLSQYIWRGFELSKDSLVIEPSVTIGYKGFAANLWGNLDTDVYAGPFKGDSKWNETDFTVSYDRSFGPVGMGVGFIYYALDSVYDSREVYVSVGLDTLLSPTFTVYREVAHAPAWYLQLGISHSFKVYKETTLDLASSVSYYYSDDGDFVEVGSNKKYRNFHNGLVSAGLTIPFGKYFAFAPLVAYSFPLSDAADDLISASSFSGDSDFLYGGVTFSISF